MNNQITKTPGRSQERVAVRSGALFDGIMTTTLTERDFVAEAKNAGFERNFIGIEDPNELKSALQAADKQGEQWPAPGWLRLASPKAMRGVRSGWATWKEPAPEGAIELQSEHEQRVACGNRWFLFPPNDRVKQHP